MVLSNTKDLSESSVASNLLEVTGAIELKSEVEVTDLREAVEPDEENKSLLLDTSVDHL